MKWFVYIFLLGDGSFTVYQAPLPAESSQASCVQLLNAVKMTTGGTTGSAEASGSVGGASVAGGAAVVMCLPEHTPVVSKFAPPWPPEAVP